MHKKGKKKSDFGIKDNGRYITKNSTLTPTSQGGHVNAIIFARCGSPADQGPVRGRWNIQIATGVVIPFAEQLSQFENTRPVGFVFISSSLDIVSDGHNFNPKLSENPVVIQVEN